MSERYSDDRLSLAQEIRLTLAARSVRWVPDTAGPDLITAVARALDDERRRLADLHKLAGELAAALDAFMRNGECGYTLGLAGELLTRARAAGLLP